MLAFDYVRASDPAEAIDAITKNADGRYLGGGTNLVDLMRETIEQPRHLIDITGLEREVRETEAGGLLIGAGVRNTALAEHPVVRVRYPVLARAILSGASAQIRNMATVGGNLLQRTRCYYFYDQAAACNKRIPRAGCDAIGGFNRIHAILGASDACIATHPSDMCVALAALAPAIYVDGPRGRRRIPFSEFHRLPGEHPEIETALGPGELITAVELPADAIATRSTYRKVRDRASYAFALVSVAAALEVEDGIVRDVRIALGGVATRPWRAEQAEARLVGQAATPEQFRAAAEAELAAARPLRDNAFKIELATRTIVAVLEELAA